MTSHSLILRDWEVRGILEGRICELRRPIKPQPDHFHRDILNGHNNWDNLLPQIGEKEIKSPFGQVGDLIRCKETWNLYEKAVGQGERFHVERFVAYKADIDNDKVQKSCEWYDGTWRSPVHMPREYSRIILQTDEIWAERLQEITVDGAHKCGFDYLHEEAVPYQKDIGTSFVAIWNRDYQKQGLGWDANPYVFAAKVHRWR